MHECICLYTLCVWCMHANCNIMNIASHTHVYLYVNATRSSHTGLSVSLLERMIIVRGVSVGVVSGTTNRQQVNKQGAAFDSAGSSSGERIL